MSKKTYFAPEVDPLEIRADGMVCASGTIPGYEEGGNDVMMDHLDMFEYQPL